MCNFGSKIPGLLHASKSAQAAKVDFMALSSVVMNQGYRIPDQENQY